jgi:hypothetical protein
MKLEFTLFLLCQRLSAWIEHGRVTEEMRAKMLAVLIEKEKALWFG